MDTYEVKTHEAGMSWTGLAAQVWDPSGGDSEQPDLTFIQKLLDAHPGPALDVGCGTGRLLVRYLAAGYDVDGVDTSADMLAICHQKAEARGLKAKLYQQAMQNLDLPRQYRMIFIPCGTFCLITDWNEAIQALRRIYAHLLPGGVLAFNLFWPFGDHAPLSDKSQNPDGAWNPMWTNTLPDGREVAQHYRLLRVDRVEQVLYAHRRYRLIEDGQVVGEEIFAANERIYLKHEVVLMLEKAGFHDIQVTGNWTDEAFAEPHYSIVFTARK